MRQAAQLWTILESFYTDSWKENINFPYPPFQSTSSTKKTNPDSSRSLLLLSRGTSLTPGSQKDHPCNWGPPPFLPLADASHYWPSTGRPQRKDSGAREHPSPTACTSKKQGTAPPLLAQRARCSRRDPGTGKEPGTNAATDWQWREFYYYPIITLGSVPKWSMLPPWCHFLLSWLETKSGSMGAIHMMSLQFTAAAPPSLSVCLKYTERSILPKNG